MPKENLEKFLQEVFKFLTFNKKSMENENRAVARGVGRLAYEVCTEDMCENGDKLPITLPINFDEKLSAPKYDYINHNLTVKPTVNPTESVFWLGRAMPRYFINWQSNGEYCGLCHHRNYKDVYSDRKRLMWEDGAEYRMLEKILEEFRGTELASEDQKILREPSKLIEKGLGFKPKLKVAGIDTVIGNYNYRDDISGIKQTLFRRRISCYGWKKVRELSKERFKYLLKDKKAHEKLDFKDKELIDPKSKKSQTMIGLIKGGSYFVGASIFATAAKTVAEAISGKIDPSSLYDLDYIAPLFSASLAIDGIRTKNVPQAIAGGVVYFTKLGLDMPRVFHGDMKPLIANAITVSLAALNEIAAEKAKKRKEMLSKSLK